MEDDPDLIDLADWRELVLEAELSEGEAEALRGLPHRAVQGFALDGQIPAVRINRRWQIRRGDGPVIRQRLLGLAGRRRPQGSSAPPTVLAA